jgi:predicted MFS family arabinose efflux permease
VSQRAFALAKFAFVTQCATVLGGPLAGMLLALNGRGGRAGWQWLFLAEGLPAIALGLCILRWLPDANGTVAAAGPDASSSPERPDASLGSLRAVAQDWRYWGWAVVFFAYNLGSSALRLWQPTMLRALSQRSDFQISLMSAVPSVAGAVAIVLVGYSSRRTGDRRWHLAIPLACGAVGLLLVSNATSASACVAAAALATTAVACQPPLFASVTAASSDVTRAAAIAFVNSLAMCGSFFGPTLVGYARGITGSFEAAYVALAVVLLGAATLGAVVNDSAVVDASALRRQPA